MEESKTVISSYLDYFYFLKNYNLISPIYEYVLKMLENEIDNGDKDNYLILFAIYFSLLNAGNITMSLNKETLKNKWFKMLDEANVLVSEEENYDQTIHSKVKEISNDVIDNYLDKLETLTSIIGNTNKLFIIDNNYLYAKKYYDARKGIKENIERLFALKEDNIEFTDYPNCLTKESKIELSTGQLDSLKYGVNQNLIITGGPGTGKTTSVLFLLFALLNGGKSYEIHLVAPSGKASSRMKESIVKNLNDINDDYKKEHSNTISIIQNLEESTIHRLLEIDYETNGFKYNKEHQFNENSIFIIDEASMIDACLFNSLLDAIRTGSRVFIMGDKDQLPSVECGSVFGDLVKNKLLNDNHNVITLDESIRFKDGTEIYKLAKKINEGLNLDLNDNSFKDPKDFKVESVNKDKCPIFYYKMPEDNQKEAIKSILEKWGKHFYNNGTGDSLQEKASNLDSNLDSNDNNSLKELFDLTEEAKILSAENNGIRGVKELNKLIKNTVIDKSLKTSIINHYAGELMMINKNNKLLDLYNGDSGILVTFKDDPTLYFMVKKSTIIVSKDGKQDDKIFKLGDFVFYPLRLIASDEIDLAYAITIHKSQGSDYSSILVILPTKQGHPLLNRQIVYTAITRTKGNTYILSSLDRLNEAKDRVQIRDTNINI